MISLKATIRKDFGRKIPMTKSSRILDKIGTKSLKELRKQGKIPAVVYGPGVKNVLVQVDEKEFKKVFQKTGESSLIELSIDGDKEKKPVLVHEIQKDPVTDKIIHVDFFQPSLKEEVEVKIPLVFEGQAPAEKDLGGTLLKNILEIEVKALPQNLPHEVICNISSLKTFEDNILIKDLILPKEVKVLKKPDEIVASVVPAQKVEEELAVPIEEKVEEVEKVVKEKKEKEEVVEEIPKQETKEESKQKSKAQ